MNNITESLRSGDLRNLVKRVFAIDSHKSKIGDDQDIVVLQFTVDQRDAAQDLENFIEMGYPFVIDADASSGETDEGVYSVYVEIERSRHIAEQIVELIEGIKKITHEEDFRFRYFKGFKSQSATLENLKNAVPVNKSDYNHFTEKNKLDNFSEFFRNSYADDIKLIDESITFKRIYSGPISFEIINSGPKQELHDSIRGPVILEGKDMAEVMFLTKLIGNYNIIKVKDTFIFENNGWAVALKRIQ
jgi:hypothetical protein